MLTDDSLRELWKTYGWNNGSPPYLFANAVEREARREALEEAARVCEARIETGAHLRCAAAIRALIEEPKL